MARRSPLEKKNHSLPSFIASRPTGLPQSQFVHENKSDDDGGQVLEDKDIEFEERNLQTSVIGNLLPHDATVKIPSGKDGDEHTTQGEHYLWGEGVEEIEEGKPENMIEKIAMGRMNKFYKEACLLNQEFIQDSKLSVAQYLQQADKECTVTAFKRFTLRAE